MTQANVQATTLVEYSREILPKLRALDEKKALLKEWKDGDDEVQKHLQAIKDMQELLKNMIEEREADLLQEIKDLETDIKLACKAAAKNSPYKPAELKAFFIARNKEDGVSKVVTKGTLFEDLTKELA
jgi:cytochrome P450